MIVYDGIKTDFLNCVENDTIAATIENNIYTKMKRHTARNEFRSWENSLEYMYKVLNDQEQATVLSIQFLLMRLTG